MGRLLVTAATVGFPSPESVMCHWLIVYLFRRVCSLFKPLPDNIAARFSSHKLEEAGAVLSQSTWPDDDSERTPFGDRQLIEWCDCAVFIDTW